MPLRPPIKSQHTASPEIALPHQAADLDSMARRLEASGNYRMLRRLVPRPLSPPTADQSCNIGVVIDVETTGLDPASDEMIELAMLKFSYAADGAVAGLHGAFQAFHEPSAPIPVRITQLTGITDAMVAGQRIDIAAVDAFVADAAIVIAHHAAFDRRFVESLSPVFVHKPWACSASEIDWRACGYSGAKLSYLATESGFFYEAHRAIDDCHALLELLARPLPATSTTALAALLRRARRKTVRIWAEHSPYDLKDILKRRGYRWSAGEDGSPRSWYIDVDEACRDAELKFLRQEIYQRDVALRCVEFSAWERFSDRIGVKQLHALAPAAEDRRC